MAQDEKNHVKDRQLMSKMLHQMVHEHKAIDLNGRERQVTGGISQEEIKFIKSSIIERKCRTRMETGVAYGISNVAICEALSCLGSGCRHYGIDPCQYSEFRIQWCDLGSVEGM